MISDARNFDLRDGWRTCSPVLQVILPYKRRIREMKRSSSELHTSPTFNFKVHSLGNQMNHSKHNLESHAFCLAIGSAVCEPTRPTCSKPSLWIMELFVAVLLGGSKQELIFIVPQCVKPSRPHLFQWSLCAIIHSHGPNLILTQIWHDGRGWARIEGHGVRWSSEEVD